MAGRHAKPRPPKLPRPPKPRHSQARHGRANRLRYPKILGPTPASFPLLLVGVRDVLPCAPPNARSPRLHWVMAEGSYRILTAINNHGRAATGASCTVEKAHA